MSRIRSDASVLSRQSAPLGSLMAGGSALPGMTNSVNVSNLKTLSFAVGIFGPCSGVYFVYANHTASPALIDNACAATSSTAYPGGVFNIANPESGWTPGHGAVPVVAATGATQGDRNKRPALIVSPLLGVKTITRAAGELDGGKTELIFGRVVFLASNPNGTYGDLGNNFPTYWDPINEGMSILTGAIIYGTDAVANPGSVTTTTRETLPAIAIVGVIPVYDRPTLCVGGPGDSISAGLAGASNPIGVSHIFKAACRLHNAGRAVSYFQGGITGSSQAHINARARDLVALDILDIMTLACHTVNSPAVTQKDWDAQWALTVDAAQVQLNRRPTNQVLLQTPLPNNFFNATQNGFRAKQRQRCLALAAADSRISVVDYDPMTNLADGHFKFAEDTVDGTHMSNPGNDRAASFLQPVLNRML